MASLFRKFVNPGTRRNDAQRSIIYARYGKFIRTVYAIFVREFDVAPTYPLGPPIYAQTTQCVPRPRVNFPFEKYPAVLHHALARVLSSKETRLHVSPIT